jgi:hypothetical protein
MMTIENASEMVKRILQAPGVFERIMNELMLECECKVGMKTHCVLTSDRINRTNNKGYEIIHIGASVGRTNGHYAGAIVNHSNRRIYLSDSMGKMGGETVRFRNALLGAFKNYAISNESFNVGTQPTGGFFPTNVRQLKIRLRDQNINPDNIKSAYLNQILDITQYDEMAQHHFCYVEAFVYLCHKVLKTPIGPRQPRDRIVFIKKVIWGLMKKFNLLSSVKPAVVRYVVNNFPYYIKMLSASGGNIPLRGSSGLFHFPNIPAEVESRKRTRAGNAVTQKLFSTRLVKITMPDVNSTTTLRQIINMSAR